MMSLSMLESHKYRDLVKRKLTEDYDMYVSCNVIKKKAHPFGVFGEGPERKKNPSKTDSLLSCLG